ncbi:hypothetical protein LguiA_008676 [Lonicera macranthoides]
MATELLSNSTRHLDFTHTHTISEEGEIQRSFGGEEIQRKKKKKKKKKKEEEEEEEKAEEIWEEGEHAGHAAVRDSTANETHFNLKIVSTKFDGQSLVKRHRMVYDLLADELQSGLHALSIVAKTPKEVSPN